MSLAGLKLAALTDDIDQSACSIELSCFVGEQWR